MMTRRSIQLLWIGLLIVVIAALPLHAQEPTPAVTADQVNQIAGKMYCPVCENIPLDVCGTDACIQWREEIKTQLEAGRTPDEIINEFVARYGDRVVGVPQDPMLRNLSLVTPWLIGLVVVAGAGWLFMRWSGNKRKLIGANPLTEAVGISDEDYRARLERDLQARR